MSASQSTAPPDVSVLVPVFNEEAHIRDTVAAMLAQELGNLTFELVFAEGRSEDRTREVLEELAAQDSRIVVVDNPRRTVTTGLNAALRSARGRYVARMDAHSFFPRRYLAAGVERLERGLDDDVVWVAGPVAPRAGAGISAAVALALGTRLGVGGSSKWQMNDPAARSAGEIELDTGVFAGVWRRETVDRFGGWDDAWPVNEDSELAARVLAAGGRIVCLPEMAAEYLPRDSLKGLWRQYWRYGFYRAKTGLRHRSSLRPTHLLPAAIVTTALLALVGPRWVGRLARLGIGVYAAALIATAAGEARRARPRDVLLLPVVLATLHFSFGCGFVVGLMRQAGRA